jgi:hypothetical protein
VASAPVTTQEVASHPSTSSTGSSSSGGGNPPAFGQNGTLGPGQSPNG